MKGTGRIVGLTILLLFLWLFNSYYNGDFQQTIPETMAQMDARFAPYPESELSEKQMDFEKDLEKYEQTVNAIHDTIRERINTQETILDDTQVQLRPTYDTPRYTDVQHREMANAPPVPKIPNAM